MVYSLLIQGRKKHGGSLPLIGVNTFLGASSAVDHGGEVVTEIELIRSTANTAVRLAVAHGTNERFWLELQADYDFEEVRRMLGKVVEQIERIAA